MAEMELDKTRKFQAKDAEIFSRNEIIESNIDEHLSRARMEHAQEAEAIEKKLTRSKLAVIGVEKKKAELSIQQARAGLEAIEKAPHAGIPGPARLAGRAAARGRAGSAKRVPRS
jgi:hypothetical protein